MGWYVPAGHISHAPAPTALLNVPASHAAHATPSDAAVYPATHEQSDNATLPDAELVRAGHAEQPPAPVAALNVPAAHAVQATPSDGPLCPAKHEQSVRASLPPAELV